ncbi:Isochorismatase hydrolase [Pisolithus croceorrhizus]|nr:Isochorismatase hydrolase [Pisolithus croceorrhizus]
MSQSAYNAPIYSVIGRPRAPGAVEYGNAAFFWVEYPSGLIVVDGDRMIRVHQVVVAVTIIGVQNRRVHSTGLKCVNSWLMELPALLQLGVKVLWTVSLTVKSETNPSVVRSFSRHREGGFGLELPGSFWRLLMCRQYDSELYGPLQAEYLKAQLAGSDIWIHKNNALDLYLQENGITTLLIGGAKPVIQDSKRATYDCVFVKDITVTTSPSGGLESVI